MNLFFSRIKEMISSLVKFLTRDLWYLDFSELSKARAKAAKGLMVIIFTVKKFLAQRVGREAVALTYFCFLAIIPIVALIMFIASDFGIDEMISNLLYRSFPTSGELIDNIKGLAANIVKSTENGLFGWISFLTFVWTVIWLMINIEVAFNRIWEVPKQRKLWKRLIIYSSIIVVAPFVLILFLYGWIYYVRFIGFLDGKLGSFSFMTTDMFWVTYYLVAILTLSVIYKFIPNTKIRFGSSLRAAMVSGAAFSIVQYLYVSTQMFITRLSAVYGVLAFIPLLLVWLNICWQIILFGAMLCRGFHTHDMYEIAERHLREHKNRIDNKYLPKSNNCYTDR